MAQKIPASLIAAVQKSYFNSAQWQIAGSWSLEELWAATMPGAYKKIKSPTAVVEAQEFDNGDVVLRIPIELTDGSIFNLKVSDYSNLQEDDEINVADIKAYQLKKGGEKDIVRYDVEVK